MEALEELRRAAARPRRAYACEGEDEGLRDVDDAAVDALLPGSEGPERRPDFRSDRRDDAPGQAVQGSSS